MSSRDQDAAVPPHPFDKQWYAHVDGKTYGPYTGNEIHRMINLRQIVESDLLCPHGGSDWLEARDDPTLSALFRPQESHFDRRRRAEKILVIFGVLSALGLIGLTKLGLIGLTNETKTPKPTAEASAQHIVTTQKISRPEMPIAAQQVTLPSDNRLELTLTNAGAIIGQGIACNISKDRLLRVMAAQAATVEVLSNKDPKVMKLRNDIIELAAKSEKNRLVSRCGEIEVVFSGLERLFTDQGIMLSR